MAAKMVTYNYKALKQANSLIITKRVLLLDSIGVKIHHYNDTGYISIVKRNQWPIFRIGQFFELENASDQYIWAELFSKIN